MFNAFEQRSEIHPITIDYYYFFFFEILFCLFHSFIHLCGTRFDGISKNIYIIWSIAFAPIQGID